MSIIINVIDGIINSSINGKIVTKSYSEESFKELSEIATVANNASTVADYKAAIDKFMSVCQENISGYLETFHNDIFIENKTGKFFLKHNGKISAVPMPQTMIDRIKMSIDKKIDINPLLKTWIRFLRNPKVRAGSGIWDSEGFAEKFFNFIDIKYTNSELVDKLQEEQGYSQEVAEKMATTYSMKITQEGLLAGFKVSEEITTRYKLDDNGNSVAYDVYNGKKSVDSISGLITYEKNELTNEERIFRPAVQKNKGDAFFCGNVEGHIIKVGQVHRLASWDMVDCDDNTSCRPGLHVGGLDYIRGYQEENTCTHNTIICPSKIGAIPDDSTGAMRVLEYYTLDEFSGVNGSIYHSSKYGQKLDQEWETEKAEIIKKFGEYRTKNDLLHKELTDSINAL